MQNPSTVLDLFLAQVRKTPDATAASHDGATLSYRELDARADGYARHLAGGREQQAAPSAMASAFEKLRGAKTR